METGAETGRGRGWRPVDEHRMGTGTGAGTETRALAEMGTRTRIGSVSAEERRRSASNRTRVVDAMWETGGDLGGKRGKIVEKKGLVQ